MRGVPIEQKLGPMSIWRYPIPGERYVIGADVAEGKVRDLDSKAKRDMILAGMTEKADYHAAIVIDERDGRHVASWHGYCDTGDYAIAVMALGYYYNTALISPEQNGPGLVLLQVFTEYHYPNVYRKHRLVNRVTGDVIEGEIGWRTTANTRPLLIQAVAEKLKTDPECTRDKDLLRECRTMEINPTDGQARARGRNKDDRVMAWGIALHTRNEYLTRRDDPSLDPYEGLDHTDADVWRGMHERQARGRHERSSADLAGGRDHFGSRYSSPRPAPHDRSFAAELLRDMQARQRGDRGFGPANW